MDEVETSWWIRVPLTLGALFAMSALACFSPSAGTLGLTADAAATDASTGHERPPATLGKSLRERLHESVLSPGAEVIEHNLLTLAAQNHADYLWSHWEELQKGADPHLETPDDVASTGETLAARLAFVGYQGKSLGENIAFRPTFEAAVQSWLESLYSRLPLLDPRMTHVGVGKAGPPGERVFVVILGRDPQSAMADATLQLFPADGSFWVQTSWNGNELPQPSAPPGGYPSGPVLSLHVGEQVLENIEATLQGPEGATVPASLFHQGNDSNLTGNIAALIPDQPLVPKTTYTLHWSANVAGSPLSIASTFDTANTSCSALAQNCGYGRACYIQGGQAACLWVGALESGASCAFMNDCSRGGGCYGVDDTPRCRSYCGGSGVLACEVQCTGGTTTLDDSDATRFCW